MLRRFVGFILFLILAAGALGAVIATALTAVTGGGNWLVVGLTVLGLAGLVLMGRGMFRRTWAPVGELIEATRRLGQGEQGVRLRTDIRGPLTPVSRSFNKMAERLEEEDQRRRRFLADIGHELRTPMTVIRGEVEAVIDGLHSPADLDNVIDEIDLIDRLLDDLRLLSTAEAGTLRLETEPTDLVELARSALDSFTRVSSDQGVETVVTGMESTAEVEVDPHRIQQVLTNLVANALRQMSEGGRLEVSVLGLPDMVVVEVSDTGPGLPEEDLDRIFERFVRSADSTGTGLGLSISRDLVIAHGGSITAGNRAGGGAVFTVSLPRSQP
jgi:signal transduction histidine kinase